MRRLCLLGLIAALAAGVAGCVLEVSDELPPDEATAVELEALVEAELGGNGDDEAARGKKPLSDVHRRRRSGQTAEPPPDPWDDLTPGDPDGDGNDED